MAAEHPSIDAEQLKYLYQTNFARRLDELAAGMHRRLMNKLIAKGHHGLKMSFAAVLSHLGFAETRLVDIAERAGMSKQAIGQIADEIEALGYIRSEEHTSELQSRGHLVCRLLLEKKKIQELYL